MRNFHLLIVLLSFENPIIASARVVKRQPQGGGFWPDWNLWDLGEGVINGIEDGVTTLRGFINPSPNQQGSESDSSKTNPPPNPDADTQPEKKASPDDSPVVTPASPPSPAIPAPAEPVYKIEINNNPSPLASPVMNPPAILPSVDQECDLININDADCGKPADQLVFTSSCASFNPNQVISTEGKAQNQAIQETLVLMDGENVLAGKGGPGIRISTFYLCDVYFFAVPLTKKQVQEIEAKPGVKIVRPNRFLSAIQDVPETSDPEDSDSATTPELTAPKSQFKERDQIVADEDAWNDLKFISTPRGSQLSSAYFYNSMAGQDVEIIAIDSGINHWHDEFVTATGGSSVIASQIYAMDSARLEDDYDNLGTCRTSKMVGRTIGVARSAKVKAAKIAPQLSSLLDVFVKVANYLRDRYVAGDRILGFEVMSIMIQWDNDDAFLTEQFEEILDLLITEYQIVVVVPAGNDFQSAVHSDINMWPATSAARHNIIVVGGVKVRSGRTYAFSRGGPFLTVNAPGLVLCARNSRVTDRYMLKRGTDVAAALVAGLIADLLSRDDLGPRFRAGIETQMTDQTVAQRVKTYLRFIASYKRNEREEVPAIWNLLGGSSAT
ncbi:hypothetical protein MMC07_001132 [Pseudocyphellaria aurata]|nr:hypothetical protein [Pseudocyphellaria aurata]